MRRSWRAALMVSLMAATFALSAAKSLIAKQVPEAQPIDLQAMIPLQFGDWRSLPMGTAGVVNPQQDALARAIYTQTLTRIYRNQLDGQRIMLVIAYGADQRDELQVHYPEVCYPAQGFEVRSNQRVSLPTAFGPMQARQLQTRQSISRNEPVTYWAMLGDKVVLSGLQKKVSQVRMSWAGEHADGLLFRVSTIDEQDSRAFSGQSRFISDLMSTLPAPERRRLSGL